LKGAKFWDSNIGAMESQILKNVYCRESWTKLEQVSKKVPWTLEDPSDIGTVSFL
jgi:hypothetical protein